MSFAYTTHFSGATLTLGRELSDTGVGTGYQDAVTPPWEAKLALLTYALMIAVVVTAWYEFGTGRGIATLLTLIGGALLWRQALPKESSLHYKKLIVVSMARRHADWVRSGDTMRATAMGDLLRKIGVEL
jgi:hypothetical protein